MSIIITSIVNFVSVIITIIVKIMNFVITVSGIFELFNAMEQEVNGTT